jgi:hypothetical protein
MKAVISLLQIPEVAAAMLGFILACLMTGAAVLLAMLVMS